MTGIPIGRGWLWGGLGRGGKGVNGFTYPERDRVIRTNDYQDPCMFECDKELHPVINLTNPVFLTYLTSAS